MVGVTLEISGRDLGELDVWRWEVDSRRRGGDARDEGPRLLILAFGWCSTSWDWLLGN